MIVSLALTRVIASQLVGVRATDPVTFVAASVIFLCVAAVACAVPALRATHVPLVALRDE